MKIAVAAIVSLVFSYRFTGLNCQLLPSNTEPGRAIQIVTPKNHTFHLELDDLKGILETDPIRDRHVVVISIAGSFRKGKSFLLNFFIRFLDAQYKKHDISDWMGETSSANANELTGFKWRGGRKPETTGIWMWSEIYTHDFENGEKVAIILLDTQGIFDGRSSVKDNAVTFALSMMLSSVQCYNVMSNIQEDDLNHLEMFSEYARLSYEQSNEKPFQYLLFIVRDWPYADESGGYGWNGQKVIDEVLSENDEQTEENMKTRRRIKSSFNEISSYLMPHPGFVVAQSKNFTGNLQQIQPEFRDAVKELVPSLLAPENLNVKQINGQKIRARDLVQYLETYVDTFNGNTLPEPKTVFMATAQVNNLILYRDCLTLYESAMANITNNDQLYYNSTELEEIHQQAKNDSKEQFDSQRKLGDDELNSSFRQKLESSIQEKFESIVQANDDRRVFIETTKYYEKLNTELKMEFGRSICVAAGNDISSESLWQLYNTSIQDTLAKFDTKKLKDDKLSIQFREQLSFELSNLEDSIIVNVAFYSQNLDLYNSIMERRINGNEEYFDEKELLSLHQSTKGEAIKKFNEMKRSVVEYFTSCFQEKLKTEIEINFNEFQRTNNKKRTEYIRNVNTHNDNLISLLAYNYDDGMRWEIEGSGPYMEAGLFWSLHQNLRNKAMSQFNMKHIGNNDSDFVNKLDDRLESLKNKWMSANDRKKSNYYYNKSINERKESTRSQNNSDYVYKESMKAGMFSVLGAVVGGLIGGPPGAIIGAAAAGGGSASYSYYKS